MNLGKQQIYSALINFKQKFLNLTADLFDKVFAKGQ